MAKIPSKIFHSIIEFEDAAESSAKKALSATLNHFKRILLELADSSIYSNAYAVKWYKRTNWLKDENAVETYIFKNVKNEWGGGVRFNKPFYDSINRGDFQHGNTADYLEMGSYLEIMNDSSKLHNNPWHFPTKEQINRGHFYDDFLKELDDPEYGFEKIFYIYFDSFLKSEQTGKIVIPNIPTRNKSVGSVSNRIGATSSSTSQYASLNSGNI